MKNSKKTKIAVAGTGYVGLSMAVLLSQHNQVVAYDIVSDKVNKINNKISPIKDAYIEKYLKEKNLDLIATTDYRAAFIDADYIVICTPTNYDEVTGTFDTSSIYDIVQKIIDAGIKCPIVIKSTIPVGFIDEISSKYPNIDIFFSPEFLREGQALFDNLYPSRIIMGSKNDSAHQFAALLTESAVKKDIPVLFVGRKEAEAIKLFSNSYLALRVAYFNELDTYAEIKKISTEEIIKGVCLDPRIGDGYNNPSFGYGGYCFPKDTKQLLAGFDDVPQRIISAIVDANPIRKQHIAAEILERKPKKLGVYRLTMKTGSDNFRESAVQDIIAILKDKIDILIYEPTLKKATLFHELAATDDLQNFKSECDLIIANRIDEELSDVKEKVYTRDIFARD